MNETINIKKDIVNILLQLDSRIFLLEPGLLAQFLTTEQLYELTWRFNISEFKFNELKKSVTFGTFEHNISDLLNLLEKKVNVVKITSQIPFHNTTQFTHLFFEINGWKVHLVVLINVKHFLWISEIPKNTTNLDEYKINFGNYEQIFDPFQVKNIWILLVPENIEHFLSQIPTSRYLHCSPNKMNWFKYNKILINKQRIWNSIEAIIGIKSLMKSLKMEFWIMCGTLLGWYRHCHPIPYTTDTDLSTWSKYLNGKDIWRELREKAPEHGLHLLYRFGEPTESLEYSFQTDVFFEKIDLFFNYENETHYFVAGHRIRLNQYRKYTYPRFQLCSIELLGYKLLAPCEPEKIVQAEYGKNWSKPIENWDYIYSPYNADAVKPFSFDVKQFENYSRGKIFNIQQ